MEVINVLLRFADKKALSSSNFVDRCYQGSNLACGRASKKTDSFQPERVANFTRASSPTLTAWGADFAVFLRPKRFISEDDEIIIESQPIRARLFSARYFYKIILGANKRIV